MRLATISQFLLTVVMCLVFSIEAHAASHTITFGNDLRYTPSTLPAVKVGDVVTWEGDFSIHPLRFDVVPDGATKPADVTTGTTFSYTIEKEGTYAFHCTFHVSAGMEGGFVVQGTGAVDRPMDVAALNVAPNPIHQDAPLNIQLGIDASTVTQVNLCDANGNCTSFLEGTGYRLEGPRVIIPNMSFGSGAYVLSVVADGVIYRRKLIITR